MGWAWTDPGWLVCPGCGTDADDDLSVVSFATSVLRGVARLSAEERVIDADGRQLVAKAIQYLEATERSMRERNLVMRSGLE